MAKKAKITHLPFRVEAAHDGHYEVEIDGIPADAEPVVEVIYESEVVSYDHIGIDREEIHADDCPGCAGKSGKHEIVGAEVVPTHGGTLKFAFPVLESGPAQVRVKDQRSAGGLREARAAHRAALAAGDEKAAAKHETAAASHRKGLLLASGSIGA